MSRVQLALNVDDVDAAVSFYSTLFGTEPAKRRPGYANFALDDPALKLVLIENPGQGGTLNHLGVEVTSPAEVIAETRRLAGAGLATRIQEGTTCCYALQDKVWVGQEGAGTWEIYTVLADAGADLEGKSLADVGALPVEATDSACCATDDARSDAGTCCSA
jgi:catechol 2,3-dioxygenase-like lactoylglutathione lyase family enzyme